MNVTSKRESAPWLLLIFRLPSKKGSERVGVWRRLQKYGTLSLRNSGYLLPNTSSNRERFEWLAITIRGFKGEASVLRIQAIDDLPDDVLKEKFREERKPDYAALIKEVQLLKRSDHEHATHLARLKRRLVEIIEIDFFGCPLQAKAQEALRRMELPTFPATHTRKGRVRIQDFQNRTWITRPRPGIDRVSSGWLITRFIDPKGVFIFDANVDAHLDAVPFDMYQRRGFGHEGDRCTFEILCDRFGLHDKKVGLIAQAIHDADLEDGKFGRSEGIFINQVLKGWADQGIEDDELMRRGMDIIEGLYRSIV